MKPLFSKKRRRKALGSIQKNAVSLQRYYQRNIAYRLYIGRSSLYKKYTHIFVIALTLVVAFGGLTNRLALNTQVDSIQVSNIRTAGNVDVLEQGGSVQSILQATTTNNFEIISYQVQEGDTYDSIFQNFNVTEESVKLSNLDVINYYDEEPPVGVSIRIPEINGVLVDVVEEQPLDLFMQDVTAGNRIDVLEINNLRQPDYIISANTTILVPDGQIAPPPPPVPTIIYTPPPPPAPIPAPSEAVFAGVSFIDPLSNPACGGYSYSRGFSSWHNGADLAKAGGCPIRATAGGTVEFAGWSSGGEGFMVRINHGNGVKSLYFHGDGQIWVAPGQSVAQGQDIMYMGCTGLCTGTHLHFSLKYNGLFINPAPYVPYWRP